MMFLCLVSRSGREHRAFTEMLILGGQLRHILTLALKFLARVVIFFSPLANKMSHAVD